MTFENINRALTHPHRIRDATTLTTKNMTDAVLAQLTALREDADASATQTSNLKAKVEELTNEKSSILGPLEDTIEDLRLQVTQLTAKMRNLREDLTFEVEEHISKRTQLEGLDSILVDFASSLRAVMKAGGGISPVERGA
jgi:uncharacterized protein YoxC